MASTGGRYAWDAATADLDAPSEGPVPPRLLLWGADPGPVAALPAAEGQALLPSQGDGWFGRPLLDGHRDGSWEPARFELSQPAKVTVRAGAGGAVAVRAADPL
ncbi:hypothetical protein [Nonomuraea sp. SYSU D8015]|uniref:hypothetical protein n=1 Tax=Nonomuraea sp. SYSU D8015 TaxID=2593644 RepID=UPI0016612978|nr:hypothetical protein [Nonomuraea sp. SYSU D8015]